MTRPLPNLIARLRRAARPRDPDAFAHLVRRFGPMVMAVCRRALGDTPDADDAYQASFLVLVRKARTVRPPDAVGSWLFAVAHRTAVYARTVMLRRAAKLRPLTAEPAATPAVSSDLMTALDAELAGLPVKYRDAVVLCELDGRSLKEAADAVGVPVGTLASRLARGRQLLADRLRSKGFAITLASVSGLLASAGASAAAPEFDLAAPAAAPTQLAHGVMKMALLSKLKLTTAVAAVLLAAGLFGVGLLPGPNPLPVARAAPVPKDDGQVSAEAKKELDALWNKLDDPRAASTAAAFKLAKHPDAARYLKQKMKPLKLDAAEAKALLAKLFSEKEEEAAAAEKELTYLTPLLAMSLPDIWAEAKTADERRRLTAVLIGRVNGLNQGDPELKGEPAGHFMLHIPPAGALSGLRVQVPHKVGIDGYRYEWHRAERAIVVLEQIGTPDAVKVIEDMADGHPDAEPTKAAAAALKRVKKK